MTSPWDPLLDFARFGFLTRALLASVLLALACGLLSPFIVLRRLAFSADGLAHASLGGLAIGLCFFESNSTPGVFSYLSSLAFTCLVASAIAALNHHGRVSTDTAVGACYVAAFALGVLLLSWRHRYTPHLEHVFFGSLLAVQIPDCLLLALLLIGVAAFLHRHGGHLAFAAIDDDLAQAQGIPVPRLRRWLLLFLATTIVLSVKLVGLLLVASLLILPGAIACLVASSLPAVLATSIASALLAALTGLGTSNAFDLPPGPATVLALFLLFLAAFFSRQFAEHPHPDPNPLGP